MSHRSEFDERKLRKITISIRDLACGGGGVLTVERQLARIPGVEQVYVNPFTEMAYIAFDPTRCQVNDLQDVIRNLGFRPGEARDREQV